MDLLMELDKDTIYFDGIHKIEHEMGTIIDAFPKSELNNIVELIDSEDIMEARKQFIQKLM